MATPASLRDSEAPRVKGQAHIPFTYYHKTCPTLASALCVGCEPSVLTVTSRRDGDQEASLRRQRKYVKVKWFLGGNGAGPSWRG